MVALLPAAELQFSDANGAPLAGGTLATYIPGTTTQKTTWRDAAGSAANVNPIVLDAAGRAIVYGDGVYRLILKDAAGSTIYDQLSNTLVSAAMAPVCAAADIATAQGLLGIIDQTAALAALTASGTAEAAARVAADATEVAARTAAIAAEVTARNAAIAVETAARVAADAAAAAAITGGYGYQEFPGGNILQWGNASTNGSGVASVAFPIAFPGACGAVVVTSVGNAVNLVVRVSSYSASSFSVWAEDTTNHGGVATNFTWQAAGS